jgi:hypothetical protein
MLRSFPDISKSPLDHLDVTALNKWSMHNKNRLFANTFASSYDVADNAVICINADNADNAGNTTS